MNCSSASLMLSTLMILDISMSKRSSPGLRVKLITALLKSFLKSSSVNKAVQNLKRNNDNLHSAGSTIALMASMTLLGSILSVTNA